MKRRTLLKTLLAAPLAGKAFEEAQAETNKTKIEVSKRTQREIDRRRFTGGSADGPYFSATAWSGSPMYTDE